MLGIKGGWRGTGRDGQSCLFSCNRIFRHQNHFPSLADKYSIVVKISDHTLLYTVEAYSVERDTNNKQPATPCSGNARRGLRLLIINIDFYMFQRK